MYSGTQEQLEISFTVPKYKRVKNLEYNCNGTELKEALDKIQDLLKKNKSIGKGCPFLLDFEKKKNFSEEATLNMTVRQHKAYKKWKKSQKMDVYDWNRSQPFGTEVEKKNYSTNLEAVRHLHSNPGINAGQARAWIKDNPEHNELVGAAKAVIRAKRNAFAGYEAQDDKHTVECLACTKLIKLFDRRHYHGVETSNESIKIIQEVKASLRDRVKRLSVK